MSAPTLQPTTVRLTIDGRSVEVAAGSFVLGAARRLGIEVPTLCDHPDLEPVGACRLCMVEVTHSSWKGWKGLVTSCLYPVQEGLEVSTRSEPVLAARRGVLALLAARCPGSKTIRALAERHGARVEGLRETHDDDDCILCGLCTRACESYATAAITTRGRGVAKRVGSFADGPPADCVGCGGCAMVCPTGVIEARRDGAGYHIWDQRFPAALCSVDTPRCIACGSCVEACPFGVARVALGRGGVAHAVIPAEHCRGCGACVGACPTGAIEQQGLGSARLLAGRSGDASPRPPAVTVIGCARSALGGRGAMSSPARVVEVPCTGRVTAALLLAELCAGADGVLVLGRHERTCRLGGAEEQGHAAVARVAELLRQLGIEPGRVAFEQPAPGAEGPRAAVHSFAARTAKLPPLGRPSSSPLTLEREDLDTALALARQLAAAVPASAASEAARIGWLEQQGLRVAEATRPSLELGELGWLELLAADLAGPLRPLELVRRALDVMQAAGLVAAGVAAAAAPVNGAPRLTLEGGGAVRAGLRPFDDWLRENASALPRPVAPTRIATDGSSAARALVTALGHEPVDVGPDPLPDRFSLTSAERACAAERLGRAVAAGAEALLLGGPSAWLRTAMLVRPGSWRTSRVAPTLGVGLAWSALAGRSLSRKVLETPSRRAAAEEVSP